LKNIVKGEKRGAILSTAPGSCSVRKNIVKGEKRGAILSTAPGSCSVRTPISSGGSPRVGESSTS
jgi:hypothetical protein